MVVITILKDHDCGFYKHYLKLIAVWKVAKAWNVVHFGIWLAVKLSTHNLELMGLSVHTTNVVLFCGRVDILPNGIL